jgi:hypothetical protein
VAGTASAEFWSGFFLRCGGNCLHRILEWLFIFYFDDKFHYCILVIISTGRKILGNSFSAHNFPPDSQIRSQIMLEKNILPQLENSHTRELTTLMSELARIKALLNSSQTTGLRLELASIKALLNPSETTGDVAGISALSNKFNNLLVRVKNRIHQLETESSELADIAYELVTHTHTHNLLVRAKNLNLEVAGNIAREDSKLAMDQLETESLELADMATELASISFVLAGMSKRLLQRTIAAHCTRS